MGISTASSLVNDGAFSSFVVEIEKAQSVNSALDVLEEATRKLGFLRLVYSYLETVRLPDGSWAPPPLITRNLPTNWDVSWDTHDIHDPYLHACFDGGASVSWNAVQRRRDLSSAEIDSWNYLADKQLENGTTIPIHLPGNTFAFVTACDQIAPVAQGTSGWVPEDSLFVLSHHFHHTVFRKFQAPFPKQNTVKLTDRELECLEWVARGKTTKDIACILDRSPETIRIHIKRCTVKLDALNRAHAVAKAHCLGLISYPY